MIFETDYADSRQMVSWVLGLGEQARIEGPEELATEARERLELVTERHARPPELAKPARKRKQAEAEDDDEERESPIRPERFARLVTLAGILIDAAREGGKLDVAPLCESLQVTEQELRQDIDVLNVVNFGGGTYVLYAEVQGDPIEVDPEPYGDNFARPARLLPLEAKALVAAIDLIGEHLPEGSLASARKKIVDALGQDPAEDGLQITHRARATTPRSRAWSPAHHRPPPAEDRVLQGERGRVHAADDRAVQARERPGGLVHPLVGPRQGRSRAPTGSTASARSTCRTRASSRARASSPTCTAGCRPARSSRASSARIWVSPERARWVREGHRVVEELSDGAVIFERTYASLRLARPRDAQGGRATPSCSSPRRRAARSLEAAERACRHGVARSR